MRNYTIRRLQCLEDFDGKTCEFLLAEADNIFKIFKWFQYKKFDFEMYAHRNLFLVCYKNGEPFGLLLAQLYPSVFDGQTVILMQDLLYTKPGAGRAAWHLMSSFVAFGRSFADHIITMRTAHTNIKGRSLERLGFKESETHYLLEV